MVSCSLPVVQISWLSIESKFSAAVNFTHSTKTKLCDPFLSFSRHEYGSVRNPSSFIQLKRLERRETGWLLHGEMFMSCTWIDDSVFSPFTLQFKPSGQNSLFPFSFSFTTYIKVSS